METVISELNSYPQGKRPSSRRLDPELAAINVLIPRFDLDDLAGSRQYEAELAEQGHAPIAGVGHADDSVRGHDENLIPIRIYRPDNVRGALPGLLYIHGGGFMLGGLHTEEERCELYAKEVGCVVVGIDYRLAPDHPFPAAYTDCLDVLVWLDENAAKLGVDRRRIAVGGNSAGGALAASVALECRSPRFPTLVHQLLINPVLDSTGSTTSASKFTDTPVWTRADNELMWRTYLDSSDAEIDFRASPALADSVVGVASTSLWIAEHDPLRDEAYEYAGRLLAAGVPLGLQQYPGTFHGFDSYRMTKIGKRALDDQIWALRTAFMR
jgi:acetyl esterase/lipase